MVFRSAKIWVGLKRSTIMTILDIKIARCEIAKDYVFLDETQKQCACEHHCPKGTKCPLEGCFAAKSGITDEKELEVK